MPTPVESASARLQKVIRERTSIGYLPRKNAGIRGPLSAIEAFTLENRDPVLKKVFETFELDPADPHSWREIVEALVEVLKPELLRERKRAGSKKKWTVQRRKELIEAVYKIQRNSTEKMTDLEACEELLENGMADYFPANSADALRRQISFGRRQLKRIASRNGEGLPAYLVGRKNRAT